MFIDKKVHVLTQKVDSKYEKFIPREIFMFRCTTTASELILLVDYTVIVFDPKKNELR